LSRGLSNYDISAPEIDKLQIEKMPYYIFVKRAKEFFSNIAEKGLNLEAFKKLAQTEPDEKNLLALYILSQGFLIVHHDSKEERVKAALTKMGVTAIDKTALFEKLKVPKDKKQPQQRVEEPQWWRIFDEEQNIIDVCKEEWGNKYQAQWSSVEHLLQAVQSERGPIKPKLVADAYNAIHERLSR